MGRVGERIRNKVNPFKITPVYSAFLLNIKATVENGALFPCKAIWEDIEFAYILESAKLQSLKIQRLSHSKPFARRSGIRPVTLNTWDETTRIRIENDDLETPSLRELVLWIKQTYSAHEWNPQIIQLGTGLLEPEWKALTQDYFTISNELKFPHYGKHVFVISSSMYRNLKLYMISCMQMIIAAFEAAPELDLQLTLIIPLWSLHFEESKSLLSSYQWDKGVVGLIRNLDGISCNVETTVPIRNDLVHSSCHSIDGSAFVLSFCRNNSSAMVESTGRLLDDLKIHKRAKKLKTAQ